VEETLMSLTLEQARTRARARQELTGEVKRLLVDRLALDVDPDLIGDDQPLFGRGLELDSIDTLELAMAIEERFGVTITDDETESLLSLNRLADHVQANLP
jgi:acyl carrier protein